VARSDVRRTCTGVLHTLSRLVECRLRERNAREKREVYHRVSRRLDLRSDLSALSSLPSGCSDEVEFSSRPQPSTCTERYAQMEKRVRGEINEPKYAPPPPPPPPPPPLKPTSIQKPFKNGGHIKVVLFLTVDGVEQHFDHLGLEVDKK
jgi:hypothetical protein